VLRGMDTPSMAAATREFAADPGRALAFLTDPRSTSE